MRVILTAGSIKSHQDVKEVSVLVPSTEGDITISVKELGDGDETETCVIVRQPPPDDSAPESSECVWSMVHPA